MELGGAENPPGKMCEENARNCIMYIVNLVAETFE